MRFTPKQEPLTDREQSAKGKAERLKAWFDTATLPATPFKLDACITVVDCNKLVDKSTTILTEARPLSYPFTVAYLHLYHLKQYILNNGPANENNNQ